MAAPPLITEATRNHLHSILKLERACSTAAHWTEQQYQEGLSASGARRLVLVAETNSNHEPAAGAPISLLGFIVARHIAPDWELENIVVAAEFRGRGIGTRLLQELMDRAKQSKSDAIFLEVRESNSAARALYKKLRFQETGR